jgi:hypothetical protein
LVVVLLDEDDGWLVPEDEVCELLVPWFMVDVDPISVVDWFALTELFVEFLPLPTFKPGRMFAPAFTSELATPTLAFTPTFGFTLSDELEGVLEPLVLPEVPEPLVLPVPEPLVLPEVPEPLVLPVPEPLDDVPLVPLPLNEPLVLPLRFVVPEVLPLRFVLPEL